MPMPLESELLGAVNALRTAAAAFALNAKHDVTVNLGPVVSVAEVDDFERRFSITIPPGIGELLTPISIGT